MLDDLPDFPVALQRISDALAVTVTAIPPDDPVHAKISGHPTDLIPGYPGNP